MLAKIKPLTLSPPPGSGNAGGKESWQVWATAFSSSYQPRQEIGLSRPNMKTLMKTLLLFLNAF
jgi:hypothetical protein